MVARIYEMRKTEFAGAEKARVLKKHSRPAKVGSRSKSGKKQKFRRSCLMARRREGGTMKGVKVEFAEQSLSDVRSALRLAQKWERDWDLVKYCSNRCKGLSKASS